MKRTSAEIAFELKRLYRKHKRREAVRNFFEGYEKATKNLLKFLVLFCTIGIVVGFLISFFEARDKQIAESANAYAECVMENWSMTPTHYYNEFGKYPECDY